MSNYPENQTLSNTNQENQEEYFAQVVKQEKWVQQHPYRGEKKQSEKISERDDITESLVSIIRFVEHNSGNECTKSKRKPHQIGDKTNPQPYRGNCYQEQLPGAEFGNKGHDPGKEPGADNNHGYDENRGLEGGISKGGKASRGIVHLGQYHYQRNNCQVLNDQHAYHNLAGKRAEKSLVHQGLQDYHGAGKRNEGTEPD